MAFQCILCSFNSFKEQLRNVNYTSHEVCALWSSKCEEYKGEHDAWECTVIYRCAFVVIPVFILGLFCFLIHFRPLIPVVRQHSGMKFCFFDACFYLLVNTPFQMLLENCIFRRDVKGKYTDSSV